MNNTAIIIIHYGDTQITAECLNSVKFPGNSYYKIFVVDNSLDFELGDKRASVLRPQKNLGFGGGVNFGIREAMKEDFVFFLIANNDIIFTEDFFAGLSETLEKFDADEPVVLSPKINRFPEKDETWFNGGYVDEKKLIGAHANANKIIEVPKGEHELRKITFFTGALFLFTRGTVKKAGLFDESFFLYYEDLDYSLRAVRKGVKIFFAPHLLAFHRESASSKSGGKLIYYKKEIYYYLVLNKSRIIRRYAEGTDALVPWFFFVAKVSKYVLGFLFLRKFEYLKIVLKALRDARHEK